MVLAECISCVIEHVIVVLRRSKRPPTLANSHRSPILLVVELAAERTLP